MKKNAVFIMVFCVTLGVVSSGHTETIYLKNEKGSDTMILRTKPSTNKPRPRREYTDEQTLQIAPSIHYESTGRPYFPDQRPPHHGKPPHHGHRLTNKPVKPEAPNAPSRPYRYVTPQE